MTVEFASQARPIVQDERFENVGGQYREAKRLMARPFAQPGRDHAKTVKASTRPATRPSAWVRDFGLSVDKLLAEPVTEPKRPRPLTRSARRFRLADLCRQAGQHAESQRHEKAGDLAGRDLFISYLAQQAVTKAGGHHGRR